MPINVVQKGGVWPRVDVPILNCALALCSYEELAGSICELRHLSQAERLASAVLLSMVERALALLR